MATLKFENLWDNYPHNKPCSNDFQNQCAIKVGAALAKSGVDTKRLVPGKRHCWHHGVADGHILAAEELAAGLQKVSLPGIGRTTSLTPVNYKSAIAGKTGIIFFKDYWMRSVDKEGAPTGDHIDLWNKNRITDWSSWLRIQFGVVIPDVWSDFEKAKKILFWEVK